MGHQEDQEVLILEVEASSINKRMSTKEVSFEGYRDTTVCRYMRLHMNDMDSREPRPPQMSPQAGTWTKGKQKRKGCCVGYASQTRMCLFKISKKEGEVFAGKLIFGN